MDFDNISAVDCFAILIASNDFWNYGAGLADNDALRRHIADCCEVLVRCRK